MFTGLYPSAHNTYLKPDILPDEVITVAEVFQSAGYYTIGFPNNINISPGFNFGQGFDHYEYLSPDYFFLASESSSQLTYYSILRLIRERFLSKNKYPNHYYQEAAVVNEKALRYFEDRGGRERFFMFLHYMEPHDPFFYHPFNGKGYARVEMPNPPPEMADEFLYAYDQEIEYLDKRLGELFDALKKQGIWDNTIILVTADHGEEFYDHEGWWHGTTLYEELIRIPMIFKLDDDRLQGTVRTDYARQIDIPQTLLSLCNLPPANTMNLGRHLFGPSSEQSRSWTVYAEENHEGNILNALIDEKWKIIKANPDNPRGLEETELYRLDIDPGETRNMAAKEHDKVQSMTGKLETAKMEAGRNAAEKQVKEIDQDELERMKSLGYVIDEE